MMIKKLTAAGVLVSLAGCLSGQERAIDLNPGLWEITTTTEMEGMPGMSPPPQTHTQCITAESLVPQSEEASDACQMSDVETDGNTVSWKVTCSEQEGGGMEGTGTITYNGDTMEGTMEMVMPAAGMTVKNTIAGKRIGDCEGRDG